MKIFINKNTILSTTNTCFIFIKIQKITAVFTLGLIAFSIIYLQNQAKMHPIDIGLKHIVFVFVIIIPSVLNLLISFVTIHFRNLSVDEALKNKDFEYLGETLRFLLEDRLIYGPRREKLHQKVLELVNKVPSNLKQSVKVQEMIVQYIFKTYNGSLKYSLNIAKSCIKYAPMLLSDVNLKRICELKNRLNRTDVQTKIVEMISQLNKNF